MRKIPLHSLILWFDSEYEASELFDSKEIISWNNLLHEFQRPSVIKFTHKLLEAELMRRIEFRLSMGERVVVKYDFNKKINRESIANLGVSMGVPVFYIGKSFDEDMLDGDSIAEVLKSTNVNVLQLPKLNNVLKDLMMRGFNGITAVADVHGKRETLKEAILWAQRRNHFLVFLGDILDYGPKPLECIEEVYDIIIRGHGLSVIGNHEKKIWRWLQARKVGEQNKLRLSTGNKITVDAFENLTKKDQKLWENKFIALYNLSTHHLNIGNTIFVHAAAHLDMWNNFNPRLYGDVEVRALFGQLSTATPFSNGQPNRIYDWIDEIPTGKQVIVGHDIRSKIAPVTQKNQNGGQAIFLDTGSGKGGVLSTIDLGFENNGLVIKNFNQY